MKLNEDQVGAVQWKELAPQLVRDSIILVATDLDISLVSEKVAKDDKDQIESWIAEGLMSKPTIDQIQEWQTSNPKFICSIVQPFVLVQMVS